MNPTPLYIPRDDYNKLRVLVNTVLRTNASATLQKLRGELDRAAVIDPAACPDDVVRMDTRVEFEDVATGEIEDYILSYPDRADVETKRLSVLAPIGTALLGARVGQLVNWPTPGGDREIRLLRVTPAPLPRPINPLAQLLGVAS